MAPRLKKKKKGQGGGREVNTCTRYSVPYVVVNWVYEFPYVDFLISAPYITLTWMSKLPEEKAVGYIFSSSVTRLSLDAYSFFLVQLAAKGKDGINIYFFGAFMIAWEVEYLYE